MAGLKELIERVEKATGPDRKIDGLAWKLIYEQPGDVWRQLADDDVWYRADPVDTIAYDAPPYNTVSVDAVIALIGEKTDWHWILHGGGNRPAHAVIDGGHGDIWIELAAVDAPTPALALLLAFLRSWEAKNDA